MSLQSRIEDAVARYHVIRGTFPAKIVVPEGEFYQEHPDLFTGETGLFFRAAADGHEYNLPVMPGKVTDITLFRNNEE